MSDPQAYGANEVTVELSGTAIERGGSPSDSFVEIGADPTYTTESVGADGDVTISVRHDRQRRVDITVAHPSSSSSVLAQLRERPGRLIIRRTDGTELLNRDALAALKLSPTDRKGARTYPLIVSGG